MKRNSSCKHTCTQISIIPILFSAVSGPLPPFVPVFSYFKKKIKFTFDPWEFFCMCAWECLTDLCSCIFCSFSFILRSLSTASLLSWSTRSFSLCLLSSAALRCSSFFLSSSSLWKIQFERLFLFCLGYFYIFRENVLMLKVNVSVLSLNSIVTSRPF